MYDGRRGLFAPKAPLPSAAPKNNVVLSPPLSGATPATPSVSRARRNSSIVSVPTTERRKRSPRPRRRLPLLPSPSSPPIIVTPRGGAPSESSDKSEEAFEEEAEIEEELRRNLKTASSPSFSSSSPLPPSVSLWSWGRGASPRAVRGSRDGSKGGEELAASPSLLLLVLLSLLVSPARRPFCSGLFVMEEVRPAAAVLRE